MKRGINLVPDLRA